MRDPEKPQQIIEAAIRVFARATTARACPTSPARPASRAAHVRAQLADEPDAMARLRRLVALHFSVLEGHPDLAEVVRVELRQGQKFFRGASAHEVSSYFALIQSILEDGMAAGQIRADVPAKVATKMLFGAMDQLATSWVLGKRAYRLADAGEAVATIFLRGVLTDGV